VQCLTSRRTFRYLTRRISRFGASYGEPRSLPCNRDTSSSCLLAFYQQVLTTSIINLPTPLRDPESLTRVERLSESCPLLQLASPILATLYDLEHIPEHIFFLQSPCRMSISSQPFSYLTENFSSATGSSWEKYKKEFADDEIEEKKITPLTDE
jgi:hypothetical protein